ncbi:DDE-type integrase/transposase/recombinase, partial [Deinococcus sp. 43]|uniref:DDE-type integrase/transposase/recombinase n=1 Tax=Deinococcus sp. 43 TaxID=532020 RepID=UPI00255F94F6|nr:hypothetical protein [Deinococcus sp. 43]
EIGGFWDGHTPKTPPFVVPIRDRSYVQEFCVQHSLNLKMSGTEILTLTDEFTRESLALRVAESFTSRDVKDVLQDVIAARGAPRFIRSDNGPEFIARDLGIWLAV